MNSTPSQQEAITARGNVLLNAGPGTGKTHVLVERFLNTLMKEQSPVSLDQIQVFTLTEAGTFEVRRRLESACSSVAARRGLRKIPGWLDNAGIRTLHSFCLMLVREHFSELDLSPEFTVLDEAQTRSISHMVLDSILEKKYAEDSGVAEALEDWIQPPGPAA